MEIGPLGIHIHPGIQYPLDYLRSGYPLFAFWKVWLPSGFITIVKLIPIIQALSNLLVSASNSTRMNFADFHHPCPVSIATPCLFVLI